MHVAGACGRVMCDVIMRVAIAIIMLYHASLLFIVDMLSSSKQKATRPESQAHQNAKRKARIRIPLLLSSVFCFFFCFSVSVFCLYKCGGGFWGS